MIRVCRVYNYKLYWTGIQGGGTEGWDTDCEKKMEMID